METSPTPTASRETNRDLIGQQLDRVTASRTGQDTITWTIFSVFLAAHAVLVAAIVARSDRFSGPETSVVLSVIGAASAWLWRVILWRSLEHLAIQENLIAVLECRLNLPSEVCVSASRNPSVQNRLGRGRKARPLMGRSIRIVFFAWIALLVRFTWQWIR
jgi:hypothetical protein